MQHRPAPHACFAFEDDIMEQVDKQLRTGISPGEVLVDLTMKSLRNRQAILVRIGHERLVKIRVCTERLEGSWSRSSMGSRIPEKIHSDGGYRSHPGCTI